MPWFQFEDYNKLLLTISLTSRIRFIKYSWHSENGLKRRLVKLITKIRWLGATFIAAACVQTDRCVRYHSGMILADEANVMATSDRNTTLKTVIFSAFSKPW